MTNVMLIEDDPTMLSLLSVLLEIEGYTVLHPADDQPESVISALHEMKPQVVLMDVHLRLFNGLEMVEKLSQDPNFPKTQFIISSGMDFKEEAQKCGAAAFLLKPYMPDDLLALIRQLCG